MTLKPPHETFVRTATELTELWHDMMGSGGFARRSLWMIFLAFDGELAPVVVPIEDIPVEPDEQLLRNLGKIVADLLADGHLDSAAFLLSRPGPSHMLDNDRRWARELLHAFGSSLCVWPIHLATKNRIQVIAPDDLVTA
jgi:hypothetical protein